MIITVCWWWVLQEWVHEQITRVDQQRVIMDIEQELVLNTELKRLALEQGRTEALREHITQLDRQIDWRSEG